MGKPITYNKIKVGQMPGDLPPEELRTFPTRGAKKVMSKKEEGPVQGTNSKGNRGIYR